MNIFRRHLLRQSVLAAATATVAGVSGEESAAQASAAAPRYAPVSSGQELRFPDDHGAHRQFRTEWWYLTGWLDSQRGPIGFQITFFRSRTEHSDRNPSRFAAKQILFAHAALAPSGADRLLHDQRASRQGFADGQIANAGFTAVNIGDWSLQQDGADRYVAQIHSRQFTIALTFKAADPPWLQGHAGYSRKGPEPKQASYYYSRPQLQVAGAVSWRTQTGTGTLSAAIQVGGTAWLDHEWSSELLDQRASGWDWLGLNLDNGDALMAFRIRQATGPPLWQHAALRPQNTATPALATPSTIEFSPQRHWRSPRTNIDYPVQMSVQLDSRRVVVRPLIDDQELDSRASTGIIYWEGAVTAYENEQRIGRGYLELTGYGQKIRL